jgi:hypothetical protein
MEANKIDFIAAYLSFWCTFHGFAQIYLAPPRKDETKSVEIFNGLNRVAPQSGNTSTGLGRVTGLSVSGCRDAGGHYKSL